MASARRAVLSFDIGGTKLAVGVVTDDGRTHGLLVEPTRREHGPDEILPRLFSMGRRSMASFDQPDAIAGIGIACGGPLDAGAGVLNSPLHLPGWIDVPIVDLAQREYGLPAALENDATAGALAEFRYGAARTARTMVYLTVSTGIGGGAVIDGRLHRGAANNGGEFGHLMVRSGGRRCQCGRRGCLEGYASGTSIAERAREALAADGIDSSLRALPTVRAEDVVAAAAAGDRLADRIWTETVDALGIAVTDLVNVFEPDIVVLGGGVTRSGDALLLPLREHVRADAMPPAARAAQVVLADHGVELCVVGAGAVAFDHLDAGGSSARPIAPDPTQEAAHA